MVTKHNENDSVDYSTVIREFQKSIPEQMDEHDVPGLAIALIDGHDLVWAQGFGCTDRTKEHQVTPDTPFSIQSTSKTYTATGFLIAVSRGLVQLDDPLRKYYPEFRVNSRFGKSEVDKITLRHLLSHWAGLCHEAPIGNNYDDRECTFEEHIQSISDSWLMCPVGQRFNYSNLGFDLAGYVLRRISNKPFIEYMAEGLFEPLGMTNSTYDQRYVMENCTCAKGHTGDHQAPFQLIPMIPAGSVFASVRDMAKFISFHLAGGIVNGQRLVDEDILKSMYEPQFAAEKQVGGYGLGILSLPQFGTTCLDHGGGGYGYRAAQKWFPEYNIGIVVLINQEAEVLNEIADGALGKMIEAKYGSIPKDEPVMFTDRPVVQLEIDQLCRLEGDYRFRGNVISVGVKEGALYLRGQQELSPHSETEFTWPDRALITFELDSKNRPKGMQYLGKWEHFYYPIDHTPTDAPGPDKEEWNTFTGIYSGVVYGNVYYCCVTIRNGYLYRIHEGNLGGARLNEYRPGIFFDTEGEAVIFDENGMTYGNAPMVKEIDPYRKVLKLAEVDPSHRRLRDRSLESLGYAYLADNADRAIDVFLLNARLHPKSVSALVCLAEAYLNQDDRTNARKYYQQILDIDPENEKAREMLDAIRE